MNKHRASIPIEQEIGEAIYTQTAQQSGWQGTEFELDESGELVHLRNVANEEAAEESSLSTPNDTGCLVPVPIAERDKQINEWQKQGYRIGSVVVESAKPAAAAMTPLNWGVITRFDKHFGAATSHWRPMSVVFINKQGEYHFNPKELLIVYHAAAFNVQSEILEKQRLKVA